MAIIFIKKRLYAGFFLLCAATAVPCDAGAENFARPTPSLMGPLGLNTVPSARMEDAGYVRLTLSTLDPYAHAALSVQATDFLNITLRQTAEMSGLNDNADRLYPGIDLKLRLLKENKFLPDLSLGIISSTGHKRMAGEYLAISKRYRDFDFTAGIGWGRYGSSGTLDNPLGSLGGHFDGPRSMDGEMPNGPEDWFTGPDAGFFSGVEYHTPLDGLSLKLDWGGDRFVAEKTSFDFDSPAPWSAGFSYAFSDRADIGAAIVGGDKVLATLTLRDRIDNWPGRNREASAPVTLRPYRTDLTLPAQMAQDAARQGRFILHTLRRNAATIWARLDADPRQPMPQQVGEAARHMANHAGPSAEELLITPEIYGFSGPAIRLIRRDLEQALVHHQGSPQELWRNAILKAEPPDDLAFGPAENRFSPRAPGHPLPQFRFILDTQTSLSEEDSGILFRTSGILEVTERFFQHLMAGMGIRVNGPENLGRLEKIRPPSPLPVRSNIVRFADKTVTLDRMYGAWTKSYRNGTWHTAITAGYLEEMYAGIGGEILYRPFGKTFALGGELWEALKRDPSSTWSMLPSGDHLLTGHLKAWYELPDSDVTVGLKVGRYLAEDIGGTLSLTKSLDNGARFEAFATATDMADADLFGGTTHLHSGLRFTMPLGNLPAMPRGSEARFTAMPLGRDYGQSLDTPLPLYETTEPLSYRHLARNWAKTLE